ncbi:MAG: hypothetical protein AAB362_01780 [Patescibacteria group bacterium]
MASKEKINQVIYEYINRTHELFLRNRMPNQNDQDYFIDCPDCEKEKSLQYHTNHANAVNWYCVWSKCTFQFPPDLVPPSPEELASVFLYEEVLALKQRVDKLLDSSKR